VQEQSDDTTTATRTTAAVVVTPAIATPATAATAASSNADVRSSNGNGSSSSSSSNNRISQPGIAAAAGLTIVREGSATDIHSSPYISLSAKATSSTLCYSVRTRKTSEDGRRARDPSCVFGEPDRSAVVKQQLLQAAEELHHASVESVLSSSSRKRSAAAKSNSSSSASGSKTRGRERHRGTSMRSREPSDAVAGTAADHSAAGTVSSALVHVSEVLRAASPSDRSSCWSAASADRSDNEEDVNEADDDSEIVREFTLEPAVLSSSARGRRLWSSPEAPRSRQVHMLL
jgi:hypothetical protein